MHIRVAESADADKLSTLIYSSGQNSLNAMFLWGDQFTPIGFLRSALQHPLGQFGYQHHIVVTEQSVCAAVGCSWTHETTSSFRQATMESLVSYFGHERTLWVLERSQLIAELIPAPSASELAIGHIAVDEAFRGRGCGSALIEHFTNKARAANKQFLVLDVETHNHAAIALYKKHGFTIQASRSPSEKGEKHGLTKHYHMQKLL